MAEASMEELEGRLWESRRQRDALEALLSEALERERVLREAYSGLRQHFVVALVGTGRSRKSSEDAVAEIIESVARLSTPAPPEGRK